MAVVRTPAFRRMWAAQFVSHLGSWLHIVAASWLVADAGGSPLLVSVVVAAPLLPQLLLAVPAGALADAWDRRRIIFWGHVVMASSALALAWLAAVDLAGPGAIIGFSLAVGVGGALAHPAFVTFVPELVPPALLPAAIGANAMAYNLAKVLGPAVGGALVAAGLAPLAFALNGASFVAVIAATLRAPGDPRDGVVGLGLVRASALGLRTVRSQPTLHRPITLVAAFAFLGIAIQALLPTLVERAGAGPGTYGGLLLAFGLGGVAGSLIAEPLRRRLTTASSAALAIALMAVANLVEAVATSDLVMAAGLVVAGASWVWGYTALTARVQLAAPADARNRVMSIFGLASLGPVPLGAIAGGALATATSVTFALICVSLMLGVVAARVALREHWGLSLDRDESGSELRLRRA